MLFRPNVLVPRFLGSSALSTILMCHTPAVSLLSGHRGAASMTSLANLDVGKLQVLLLLPLQQSSHGRL